MILEEMRTGPSVITFKERAGKPGGGKGILTGEEKSFAIPSFAEVKVCYPVQNHPQDSRVTIEEDATTVQTLNAKMGTGGATRP